MDTPAAWPQLLAHTTTTLTAPLDPDGPAARQALGLAAAAGLAHPGADADWDLCTVTVLGARQRLTAGLDTPDPLPVVTAPAADDAALRQATIGLLHRLADGYQTAAGDHRADAWRRLVWIDVADHLTAAAAELQPAD